MTADYNVQVRVRNNFLLQAIRRSKYATASDVCRAAGISVNQLSGYVNLRKAPINKFTGDWRLDVLRVSKVLGVMPATLFPPQHINEVLDKNVAEFETTIEGIQQFVEGSDVKRLMQQDAKSILSNTLEKVLTPRERLVLDMRFGLDGETSTLDEVGKVIGASRERVRQIEARALRRLKDKTKKRTEETAVMRDMSIWE